MNLVDRKKEMDELENYFANARDGNGRLVLLSGEVGIGKAAIAFELLKRHANDAVCIYRGIQKTRSTPYAPFLHNVDEWKPFLKDPALIKELEEDLFSRTSLSDFSVLMQEKIFSLFVQAFREVSSVKPLILFIDNLHWSDVGSLSLLSHLVDHIPTMRVLIIGAYTPDVLQTDEYEEFREFLTNLLMKNQLTSIHVESFGKEEVAEFIREFLDVKSIEDEFVEKMLEASKGNPLFLDYAMDLFVREGVVRRKKGLTIPIYEISIPASFEEIITRSLNLLSEKARTLLEYASVQGASFLMDVLQEQMRLREKEFNELVALLEKEGFIYPVDEERYGFIHSQAREIIYGTCLNKKELHKEIANLIETLHKDDIETHYMVLADHYFRAGSWNWAVKYATKAGDEAIRLYSLGDAITAYKMALKAQRMLENEDSQITKGKLLLKLGKAYVLFGSWEEAYETFKEAAEIFDRTEKIDNIIESYHSLGDVTREMSRLNEAADWYQKAMDLAREVLNSRGIARAARGLGYISWRWGNYETAQTMLAEGEKLAREIGDPIYGTILVDSGNVNSAMGDLKKAREYYLKGVEALQETSDMWNLARAYNNLGDTYLQSKEWDRSIEYFEKCVEVARKGGFKNFVGWGLFNTAEALSQKGELQLAITYLDRALPILEEMKDINGLSGVYKDYGIVYMKLGEYDKAEAHLLKAQEYAEEADSSDIILDLYLERGRLYARRGENERAKETLTKGIELAKDMDAKKRLKEMEAELEKVG